MSCVILYLPCCHRCEDAEEFGYAHALNKARRTNQVEMNQVLSELGFEPVFKANLSGMSADESAEELTHSTCLELGSTEWSYASFELARDTAMKVLQDVRVSFPDKVATIGTIDSERFKPKSRNL